MEILEGVKTLGIAEYRLFSERYSLNFGILSIFVAEAVGMYILKTGNRFRLCQRFQQLLQNLRPRRLSQAELTFFFFDFVDHYYFPMFEFLVAHFIH